MPRNHQEDYNDLRHGPELAEKMRRERASDGRQTTLSASQSMSRPGNHEIQQQRMGQSPRSNAPSRHGSRASEPPQRAASNAGYTVVANGTVVRAGSVHSQPVSQLQLAAPGQSSPMNAATRDADAVARSTSMYQARGAQREAARSIQADMMSPRPSMPPPAPPGEQSYGPAGTSHLPPAGFTGNAGVNRSDLPPAPPTPQPLATAAKNSTAVAYGGQQNYDPYVVTGTPTRRSADSYELPPPPLQSATLDSANNSFDVVPSPPPPMLPPLTLEQGGDFDFASAGSPCLPTPPPLLPPPMFNLADIRMHDGNMSAGVQYWDLDPIGGLDIGGGVQLDGESLASENSSAARTDEQGEPLVRDTRSDLLSAIREGAYLDHA